MVPSGGELAMKTLPPHINTGVPRVYRFLIPPDPLVKTITLTRIEAAVPT